jgi:hypothetical protein
MGLSTIIFGKSVSQASMGEEGKLYGENRYFLQEYFWDNKRVSSVEDGRKP